jgi:hypothetical protein
MRDLFGEVAVTLREMQIWLFKVPRLPHYSTRRASYLRQWNVYFKVARAKEAGELSAIFGDESCEFCGQVLCREQEDILSPIQPGDELARLRRRVQILEMVLTCVNEHPTSRSTLRTTAVEFCAANRPLR